MHVGTFLLSQHSDNQRHYALIESKYCIFLDYILVIAFLCFKNPIQALMYNAIQEYAATFS